MSVIEIIDGVDVTVHEHTITRMFFVANQSGVMSAIFVNLNYQDRYYLNKCYQMFFPTLKPLKGEREETVLLQTSLALGE